MDNDFSMVLKAGQFGRSEVLYQGLKIKKKCNRSHFEGGEIQTKEVSCRRQENSGEGSFMSKKIGNFTSKIGHSTKKAG